MKESEVKYWQKQIEATKKFMAPKHKLWERLLKQYRLEFDGLQTGSNRPIKISRYYPLTRQIMASVTFKYPEIFFHVEDSKLEAAAEIYQRVVNQSLELMNTMAEVRQQTFDSLYCDIGWLKVGHNPRGDEAVVPYVANDAMAEDMTYVRRVSPFNIFPSPNCPPQSIAYAEFIFERMWVPYEFIKDDERYDHRDKIKPSSVDAEDDEGVLQDIHGAQGSDEEVEAMRESYSNRRMVELVEVHDRTHRRRYTFAKGVAQPIEDIPHPFLDGVNEPQRDADGNPMINEDTGQPLLSGDFTPGNGYLVKNGFPYIPLQIDMPGDSLYGLPPMAYVEDTQKLIIESVTRRNAFNKRLQRMIIGKRQEKERNPGIENTIVEGEDAVLMWVEDVNNALRAMPQDGVPPDTLGIESDMRNYEEQILQVSQMALGGGPARTATESSLIAGFGQLNREWIQAAIGGVFETIGHDVLRIMGDERYTPENFLVNVAQSDTDPVFQAISADMFKNRFKIDVVAGSMQPLTESFEREETLALVNYLAKFPEINREEMLRMILRTFRVPNPEKIMGPAFKQEAIRAAQLENQMMMASLLLGNPQPAQVLPAQDHDLHIPTHQGIQQDPMFQQLPPHMKQQALQMDQQHIQMHQQMMQQQAQGAQAAAGGSKTVPSSRDVSGQGDSPIQEASNAISRTRSNAQTISQKAASADPNQN